MSRASRGPCSHRFYWIGWAGPACGYSSASLTMQHAATVVMATSLVYSQNLNQTELLLLLPLLPGWAGTGQERGQSPTKSRPRGQVAAVGAGGMESPWGKWGRRAGRGTGRGCIFDSNLDPRLGLDSLLQQLPCT